MHALALTEIAKLTGLSTLAKALLLYVDRVQMNASFVELPTFQRVRSEYLDDEGYRGLQYALMANPLAGDLMQGTGGLRKVRRPDPRRGKGTRGGLRVIYYWWEGGEQFWLFTVYDKDTADDLSADQRKALALRLAYEVHARQQARELKS